MLLYKYKPPSPLEYLIDIVMHERLYCAEYGELNDPFEGQFYSTVPRPLWLAFDSPGEKRLSSVEDLAAWTGNKRICSLSDTSSDIRMWSLYAGGHRGVAVEIDFHGIEENVRKVSYVESLREWGTTILGGARPEEVLSCKTQHWQYECEHRVFSDKPYFPVGGRIRRILLGARATEDLEAVLHELAPTAKVMRATLDQDGVSVRI